MGTINIRKIIIQMSNSFLVVFKRYNEINKLTVWFFCHSFYRLYWGCYKHVFWCSICSFWCLICWRVSHFHVYLILQVVLWFSAVKIKNNVKGFIIKMMQPCWEKLCNVRNGLICYCFQLYTSREKVKGLYYF